MIEFKWNDIEAFGLPPKQSDIGISSEVLACEKAGNVLFYMSLAYYDFDDNMWYASNGDLIGTNITHWAYAPKELFYG